MTSVIQRGIHAGDRVLWMGLDRTLGALENSYIQRADDTILATIPPMFIIGAPRSGTTLLYQVLTSAYQVGYITNFAARMPHAPALAAALQQRLRLCSQARAEGDPYESYHGKTSGRCGPHEAGAMWYRWFPQGMHVYVPAGSLSAAARTDIRLTVARLTQHHQHPMIFKNTYHTMRIAPLLEALPEALFLVCQRDPLDIAQSILQGRIRTHGDKSRWWSVPPKEIDTLLQHPYWEHIPEQVYYIYQQIAQDRHALAEDHFMDVPYTNLCQQPAATLAGISARVAQHGGHLQPAATLPATFPISTGRKVDEEDYGKMAEKTRELWNQ